MRLTETSKGGGCGCKLSRVELETILAPLGGAESVSENRLLVGYGTRDDAAAYALDDERALLFTADFFTPIVDVPYDWGRIAAANAMSDIYAMGGLPLLALNLVAWPRDRVHDGVLADVLRGGRDTVKDSGAFLVGGHSIDDDSPKYGLAVVGTANISEMITNARGVPGAGLVLTKPLGTGVVATGIKRGLADGDLVQRATNVMCQLNEIAADVARQCHVVAGTDITGFGLAGHLHEFCAASGCAAEVWIDALPLISGAMALFEGGLVPDGCSRNRSDAARYVEWGSVPPEVQLMICDPQTSGGLLLATSDPERITTMLRERGLSEAGVVGRLIEGEPGKISIVSGARG
jgi:selenide, water dikinase